MVGLASCLSQPIVASKVSQIQASPPWPVEMTSSLSEPSVVNKRTQLRPDVQDQEGVPFRLGQRLMVEGVVPAFTATDGLQTGPDPYPSHL